MTSYQSDGGTPQPAASVEELLQNVGGTEDRCYRPLDEDEVFLAEIIVNIFLIQDSNSHPVFRLDTGAGPHQVGLETIGECGDTVVVVVVVVVGGGASGDPAPMSGSGVYPVIGSYFNHACCPNTGELGKNIDANKVFCWLFNLSTASAHNNFENFHRNFTL